MINKLTQKDLEELTEKSHKAILESILPIKFYIGSYFEYNDDIYVLTKEIDGEPHFEKMTDSLQWIKDIDK